MAAVSPLASVAQGLHLRGRSMASSSAVQQALAIGGSAALDGLEHALGLDLLLAQARAPDVLLGVDEASPAACAAISLVAQAVGRLDLDARLDAGALLTRGNRSAGHRHRPGRSRGSAPPRRPSAGCHAARSAPGERQSLTSSRSPCTTWIVMAVWPSL